MRFVVALLLLALTAPARAEVASATALPLVPAVHHGHSIMWKTGAIITATSVGVTLLGAGLTLLGIDHGGLGTCDITEGQQCSASATGAALFWTGIAVSIAGDGGLFFGGPITWAAGRHRPPDPN